jgi:hypothetical protein
MDILSDIPIRSGNRPGERMVYSYLKIMWVFLGSKLLSDCCTVGENALVTVNTCRFGQFCDIESGKWSWCSGMCSCVFISEWFRGQDVKNYRKYFEEFIYVCSVCTILLQDKTFCCQNTPLLTVTVNHLCNFSVHKISWINFFFTSHP